MKSLMLFILTIILTTALALLPATAFEAGAKVAGAVVEEVDATVEEAVIHFPDDNLAAAIRWKLNLSANAVITTADLLELTALVAGGAGIADLTGLEHATNLQALHLTGTDVSDVAALANLTKLTALSLDGTDVSDVAALANLTKLTALSLDGTDVSDVAALANLTNLVELHLVGTDVSDVAALANLTNLVELHLVGTDVSDVSALANLTNLTELYLDGTDVSDVSALANLTNLTELYLDGTDVSDVAALANLTQLEWLDLTGCPLSHASLHTHIPAMEARKILWVEVWFDNVAHRALLKVAGDNQEGAPNTTLPDPFVVAATDENGRPIVGLPVVFEIDGGRGTVETDANGHAAMTLRLEDEQPGVYKLTASAQGIQSWVLFNVIVTGTESVAFDVDVNRDGTVDWRDLGEVAENYGMTVVVDPNTDGGADPAADVNGDNVVDIEDLIAVAKAVAAVDETVEEGDAGGEEFVRAPAIETSARPQSLLRAADVRQWLRDAKAANADPGGIAVLERLLAVLMRVEAPPKETVLLANYPNPFNPETWIPYRLAEPAEVQVSIYALDGKLVRKLELGQMPAGTYQNRSRAAYWNGRNAQGEPVASGIYFYTLTAGEFSATRKMVIWK